MTEAQGLSKFPRMVLLTLLTLSYTVSFMDRTALGVLQERLKYDLGLADWQLGMMSGPAFAILYAFSGLPIARLAERFHRGRILAVCLVVWSGMTMACGLARSFGGLFLARMGVGIGEAGGNPVAHSLIADAFPLERRARAISVYSVGAPLGAFFGAALVGQLAQWFEWRTIFVLLGPPGLVLAVLVLWLLPDVTRSGGGQVGESPRFAAVVRDLVAQPEFRHLASGAALVVLVGYGVASFLAPFLQRQHHLPVAQAGLITGLINGLAAGLGTLLGGQLSDRLAPRSKAWLAWLPAAAAMAGAPLLMSGSFSTSTNVAVAGMMVGTLCVYTYLAPAFAAVYDLAPAGKRATATAVFYLVINLVGTGLGPPLIGALSDGFAHRAFTRGVHDGVGFDIACGLAKQADQHPACAAAMATGLGQSLFWVSGLLYWAAFHFILAGRHLKRNGLGPGKGASSF